MVDGHEIVIQEASMWTQKDCVAFKNAIKKESRMENHTDCIIKVGSGETVTVRVLRYANPQHPQLLSALQLLVTHWLSWLLCILSLLQSVGLH